MKHCPECKREYADDSLRFCLEDGTALARSDASPKSADETAVLPGNAPAPTTIAQPARPDVPLPTTVRANKTTKEIIPDTSLSAVTARVVIAVLLVISLVVTLISWAVWGSITFRRAPLVLLFLIVMLVAFLRAPRHPKVSLLVGIALGFDLIETALYTLINRGLFPSLHISEAGLQTLHTVLGVLDDFALAVILILLTTAVLTGRKSILQTS